jgi:hypothetical protein
MDLGWLKTLAELLQAGMRVLAGLVLGALVLIVVARLLRRFIGWIRDRHG